MPKRRIKLKKRFMELMDLPGELAGEVRLTQVGRGSLLIENHGGVSGFYDDCVRLKTDDGILAVKGEGLTLSELLPERLLITGRITSVGFIDGEKEAKV